MDSELPSVILDDDKVARAVFSPQMVDAQGNLTRAVFSLRHNESYISVCRMSIDGWLDDINAIPTSADRRLYGYAAMNVGCIRTQSFQYDNRQLTFDVVDKHTAKHKSHAGIVLEVDGVALKGDKTALLKPLPADTSAQPLLLMFQGRLLKLAKKQFVKM